MSIGSWRSEDTFVVLSVVATVGLVLSLIVAPLYSTDFDRLRFDPEVPTEYSFTVSGEPGMARVNGDTFDSLSTAIDRADSGDTVFLTGSFDGPVTIDKVGLTLAGLPGPGRPVVEGHKKGNVVNIKAPNTTIRNLWIRNSGTKPERNDAGVWVDADNVRVLDSRISEITFGIWLNGVNNVRLANNTIVGRESVYPLSSRGNGIQVWKSEESVISDNRITDVRDGIYYSWASGVRGRGNTMWDMRYGVHYMYSDNCVLRNNLAFDNDSGYALMVSRDLKLVGNTAVDNHGQSGHGILLKSIDQTTLENNTLVRNGNGFYVYNSLDNRFVGNLVLSNAIGVHLTAGSVREDVHANSFIANGESVRSVVGEQLTWSTDTGGNFWSGARTVDVDGDGVSEIRHRPSGLVEQMAVRKPLTKLFSRSPAFSLIRLAESSVPIIDSPGVVDYHPLIKPTRSDWRQFFE